MSSDARVSKATRDGILFWGVRLNSIFRLRISWLFEQFLNSNSFVRLFLDFFVMVIHSNCDQTWPFFSKLILILFFNIWSLFRLEILIAKIIFLFNSICKLFVLIIKSSWRFDATLQWAFWSCKKSSDLRFPVMLSVVNFCFFIEKILFFGYSL